MFVKQHDLRMIQEMNRGNLGDCPPDGDNGLEADDGRKVEAIFDRDSESGTTSFDGQMHGQHLQKFTNEESNVLDGTSELGEWFLLGIIGRPECGTGDGCPFVMDMVPNYFFSLLPSSVLFLFYFFSEEREGEREKFKERERESQEKNDEKKEVK